MGDVRSVGGDDASDAPGPQADGVARGQDRLRVHEVERPSRERARMRFRAASYWDIEGTFEARGTTFTIWLPREPVAAKEREA